MNVLRKTIPLLAIMTLATSCTEEYITREYITEEQTIIEGSQVITCFYDVFPKDWKYENAADGRKYLYAEFENKDITNKVLDKGAVIASVLYTYNVETGMQSWNNLPYVFPFFTKDDSVVGENIRFEYEHQRITFIIEDLDAVMPEDMVNPITFKVNIIVDK
ncbi:MAG: hypothetical protein MJZ33_05110 [Paludibacteraceae bacterium]|nr:hypothetical protein [Paludibacteraceae bacterium]